MRLGNLKSAETYLTLATTADPDCSECRQNLGTVFLARGKYQLALLTFHRVLQDKSYPTPWLPLYGSGMAYMKRNDYDRAIQMFEQVLEYVPAGLDLEIKQKIDRALYLKNQKGLAR